MTKSECPSGYAVFCHLLVIWDSAFGFDWSFWFGRWAFGREHLRCDRFTGQGNLLFTPLTLPPLHPLIFSLRRVRFHIIRFPRIGVLPFGHILDSQLAD